MRSFETKFRKCVETLSAIKIYLEAENIIRIVVTFSMGANI